MIENGIENMAYRTLNSVKKSNVPIRLTDNYSQELLSGYVELNFRKNSKSIL